LGAILHKPEQRLGKYQLVNEEKQNHGLERSLEHNKLIPLARTAAKGGVQAPAELTIQNTNRTVGTTLSGEIAKKYGQKGLPEDTITFKFTGSARPSLGGLLRPRDARRG